MSQAYIKHSFQNPNIVVDAWAKSVTGNELKIIQVVIRKTLGFNKEWDRIAISQFQEYTGLSRRTCQRLRDRLVARGTIRMRPSTGGHHHDCGEYCVNIGWQPDTGVKETRVSDETATGVNSDTGTGVSGDTHKTHILQNPQDKTHNPRPWLTPDLNQALEEFSAAVMPLGSIDRLIVHIDCARNLVTEPTLLQALRAVIQAKANRTCPDDKLPTNLPRLLRDQDRLRYWAGRYKPPDEPEWIKRGGETAINAVAFMLKHGGEIPEGAKQWIEQARQRLNEHSVA